MQLLFLHHSSCSLFSQRWLHLSDYIEPMLIKNGWAKNTHSGNITFYFTKFVSVVAEISASQRDRHLYRNVGEFIKMWYDTNDEGNGQWSLTQLNSKKINHKSPIFICKLKQKQSSFKPSFLGRQVISQYLVNIYFKLLFFSRQQRSFLWIFYITNWVIPP